MKFYILLLLIILITPLYGVEHVGVAVGVEGKVFRQMGNLSNYQKLKSGDSIFAEDTIRTSKGRLKVVFNDDTTIFLSNNSKIKIDKYILSNRKKKRDSVLNLISGKLKIFVAKKFSQNRFQVISQNMVIGVRGTTFILNRDGDNFEVDVLEGEVILSSDLGRFAELSIFKNQYVAVKGDKTPSVSNMDASKLAKVDKDFKITKDIELKIKTDKFDDYSLSELESKAESYIDSMEDTLKKSYNTLKNVRKEKNIIKLDCVNDKVMIIKGYLRRSENDKITLDELISQKNSKDAKIIVAKIYEAYNLVKQSDISIQSCSENTYKGKKDVEITIKKFVIQKTYLDNKPANMSLSDLETGDDIFGETKTTNFEIPLASPYF